MNEFQAEIEATEERCGRSLLCRYCSAFHEVDEDGTPQGMCQAEREHKRMTRSKKHDCTKYLEYRCSDSVETHGLDYGPYERFSQEWWECAVCGERLDFEERSQ